MSKFMVGIAALLASASAAFAGSLDVVGFELCYEAETGLQTTNWSQQLEVPQFNPALGDLVEVQWSLAGKAAGSVRFESLDAAPTTVTTNLTAEIELWGPNSTLLGVVIPLASNSDNVTEFDGVIDFGGTSGRTYEGLQADDSDSGLAPNLAPWIGNGTVVLNAVATGTSNATGAGNLITQFQTQAAASVEVCYIYVPEPATLSLLAIAGLLIARRR